MVSCSYISHFRLAGDSTNMSLFHNKRAQTSSHELSQSKISFGNRSSFQKNSSWLTLSSSSTPTSRTKYDYKVKIQCFCSQDSIIKGFITYPPCNKCGKIHPSECLYSRDGCYRYSQISHRLKKYSSVRQGSCKNRSQDTLSSPPVGQIIQEGTTLGASGNQTRFYIFFFSLVSRDFLQCQYQYVQGLIY